MRGLGDESYKRGWDSRRDIEIRTQKRQGETITAKGTESLQRVTSSNPSLKLKTSAVQHLSIPKWQLTSMSFLCTRQRDEQINKNPNLFIFSKYNRKTIGYIVQQNRSSKEQLFFHLRRWQNLCGLRIYPIQQWLNLQILDGCLDILVSSATAVKHNPSSICKGWTKLLQICESMRCL